MKKIYTLFTIILLSSCNGQSKKADVTEATMANAETETFDVVKIKEGESCIEIVTKIVETSPFFVNKTKGLLEKLKKNGGISFGITLEGSPNPEKDAAINQSETYDFNLHETYPDHSTVIARFTFDPKKEQLYEYDVVEDSLLPIDFDEKWLAAFKARCE